jgi:hypothetical protein
MRNADARVNVRRNPSPAEREKVAAKPTDEGRRNFRDPHPSPLPRRAGEGVRARSEAAIR